MSPNEDAPVETFASALDVPATVAGDRGTPDDVSAAPAPAEDDAGTGFVDLGLRPELLKALTDLGYEEPTPIQREAIPPLLAGRDLLGQADPSNNPAAQRITLREVLDRAADQVGERFRDRPLVEAALRCTIRSGARVSHSRRPTRRSSRASISSRLRR